MIFFCERPFETRQNCHCNRGVDVTGIAESGEVCIEKWDVNTHLPLQRQFGWGKTGPEGVTVTSLQESWMGNFLPSLCHLLKGRVIWTTSLKTYEIHASVQSSIKDHLSYDVKLNLTPLFLCCCWLVVEVQCRRNVTDKYTQPRLTFC